MKQEQGIERMTTAKIISRETLHTSPWVSLIRKEVQVTPAQREAYYSMRQADYVAILARTRGGLIPIVQQYRPAVEAFTWELPAGLLEPNESPESACRRELLEETGLTAVTTTSLGSYYTDTGRLENFLHAFVVSTTDPDPAFVPESGVTVAFVTLQELWERIIAGTFRQQHHVALLALASLKGIDGVAWVGQCTPSSSPT